MAKHSHQFVETYSGLAGFGMDRENDEQAIIYYLQKFSDDSLMAVLRHRLDNEELKMLFDLMSDLLRKHLSEQEYHRLFLKEEGHQ